MDAPGKGASTSPMTKVNDLNPRAATHFGVGAV